MTVDDHAGEIGYSPGVTTPYGGSLVSAPGGAAKSSAAKGSTSERTADFQTTSSKGGGDTVSFAHGRAFTIEHEGAAAGLSLTLSGFGADGLPVAVRLPKAHLARGREAERGADQLAEARLGADPGPHHASAAAPRPAWSRAAASAGASPRSAGRSSTPAAPTSPCRSG